MEWDKQFKSFLASPLGGEMIRALREDLHDNLIKDAENTNDPNIAYGLLSQARGVIKALEHIQFRSIVPKDEGDKNK